MPRPRRPAQQVERDVRSARGQSQPGPALTQQPSGDPDPAGLPHGAGRDRPLGSGHLAPIEVDPGLDPDGPQQPEIIAAPPFAPRPRVHDQRQRVVRPPGPPEREGLPQVECRLGERVPGDCPAAPGASPRIADLGFGHDEHLHGQGPQPGVPEPEQPVVPERETRLLDGGAAIGALEHPSDGEHRCPATVAVPAARVPLAGVPIVGIPSGRLTPVERDPSRTLADSVEMLGQLGQRQQTPPRDDPLCRERGRRLLREHRCRPWRRRQGHHAGDDQGEVGPLVGIGEAVVRLAQVPDRCPPVNGQLQHAEFHQDVLALAPDRGLAQCPAQASQRRRAVVPLQRGPRRRTQGGHAGGSLVPCTHERHPPFARGPTAP